MLFTAYHYSQIARVVNSTNDYQDIGTTHEHDNSVEQGSGSETLGGSNVLADDLHLYGDIVQVCLPTSLTQYSSYLLKNSSFHVPLMSYVHCTSLYRVLPSTKARLLLMSMQHNTPLSIKHSKIYQHYLFTHTSTKLGTKKKKPIPANTYVAVEGFLNNVKVDSNSGTPMIFHINVDNISFLGKAVLPNVGQSGSQGKLVILFIFASQWY